LLYEILIILKNSILDFARDSDYALHMVDELLDVLTGGEHSKTVAALPARQKPVPIPVDTQLVLT
jgi:bromodomain-containing protein 7